MVAQFGVEPGRIDILTSIDGIEFGEAHDARTETVVDGVRIPFVSLAHLIRNKRATGRAKDKLDADRLKSAARLKSATGRRRAK
jgi:hypothetical protein